MTANFCIKPGYISRTSAIYFDDQPLADSAIIHQPDVYELAYRLAQSFGADVIVDVGCGVARKLMALPEINKIGIDYGSNLEYCRRSYPDSIWIEADLEAIDPGLIDCTLAQNAIVVCADVVEHLVDPTSLLALIKRFSVHACAVLITTPERDLVRGGDHFGPPVNPSHVREWNRSEFSQFLEVNGIAPTFVGLTINNNKALEKKTILAIVDRASDWLRVDAPASFKPLALVSSYNDADVIEQTVGELLDDGIDVHVLDNWSTDGTFERLATIASHRLELVVERFPTEGPSRYYEAKAIFDRKDDLARRHPGRWIVHHDSDEIRCSPWPGISFRTGIFIAQAMGFNALDFTVCDFRPTSAEVSPDGGLDSVFSHFEFGRRPGHFNQVKVWRQGDESVRLSVSGGHDVQMQDRRVFPYKFILKHYPLRSPEHARRKIFVERLNRFSPRERENGWHIQYDDACPESSFLWRQDELIEFDAPETRSQYLVEFISGIGIIR